MAKTIFEELGGRYERQGDYLIPCLTLPAEKEQPIGLFGRRHLDYLKQHRRVTYINLLTSGRLNTYLADIDRQAQERFERLIESTKQAQGMRCSHGYCGWAILVISYFLIILLHLVPFWFLQELSPTIPFPHIR